MKNGFVPGISADRGWKLLRKKIWQYRWVYILMVLPTLLLTVLFRYLTLPGIALAFYSFRPIFRPDYVYEGPGIFKGIATFLHSIQPGNLFAYFTTSKWIGFENFSRLLSEKDFLRSFANTLIIALMKLLIAFPFPILLSLMINEMRMRKYKKVLQTVFTFPHFLSWVVVAGIILNLFGDTGAIKKIFLIIAPAVAERWNFLYNPDLFRFNLVFTDIWKEAGWGTIIFLAAIAGIDPALHESAEIDGCNRVQRIIHITLPCIFDTIIIIFLLNVGNMVNANFDQVFNLYTPQTYVTGDVIDTYIYRQSFQSSTVNDFGFTTAVGLFKSVINFALLVGANTLARRFGNKGIM